MLGWPCVRARRLTCSLSDNSFSNTYSFVIGVEDHVFIRCWGPGGMHRICLIFQVACVFALSRVFADLVDFLIFLLVYCSVEFLVRALLVGASSCPHVHMLQEGWI